MAAIISFFVYPQDNDAKQLDGIMCDIFNVFTSFVWNCERISTLTRWTSLKVSKLPCVVICKIRTMTMRYLLHLLVFIVVVCNAVS